MPSDFDFIARAETLFTNSFGEHTKEKQPKKPKKVKIWHIRHDLSVALEINVPIDKSHAEIWLPYLQQGHLIPEIAQEYAPSAGRHSNVCSAPGLKRDAPVLKLWVTCEAEFSETLAYIFALYRGTPLPEVKSQDVKRNERRWAIRRDVLDEVWLRDGGQCVKCKASGHYANDKPVKDLRFWRIELKPDEATSSAVSNLQMLCKKHETEARALRYP
jgi:hypothetical protein